MSQRGLLGVLVALMVAGFLASLALGPVAIDLGEALRAVFGDGPEALRLIVLEIRLPRALLALAIGAALGISGAALQGYLRNPLAEPGVIGVSAAGALGGTQYEARRCPLGEGAHRVTGAGPFGITAYGYGPVGSYAFAGGAAVRKIYEPPPIQ